MKKLAFATAKAVGNILPTTLQHIMIKGFLGNKRMVDRYGFTYLSLLSDEFNIVALSASGEYGTMSSAPRDVTIFKHYAENGVWASSVNRRLKEFFKSGHGTYLDIGANIGMTVVPLARDAPSVRCHAFEPEPVNYQNLVRNIHENCQGSEIASYQLALHDRDTVLPFSIASDNLGDHRLYVATDLSSKQGEAGRKIIDVPCKRLDDLAIDVQGPTFVKVDTQGAEPHVVTGGAATLAKADTILMEWSPYHMARLKSDPNIVLDFLERSFKFGTIEKTDGELDAAMQRSPMKAVSDRLRGTIEAWRDDPFSYVDIIAEKI